MNPGKTIKVLRTAADISQKEFARQLDISPSYLSLIESGEREPSAMLLRRASRLLGVPISVFYFQIEEAEETLTPSQQEEHRLAREVLGGILGQLLTSRPRRRANTAPETHDSIVAILDAEGDAF